jgi:hypothetical protein
MEAAIASCEAVVVEAIHPVQSNHKDHFHFQFQFFSLWRNHATLSHKLEQSDIGPWAVSCFLPFKRIHSPAKQRGFSPLQKGKKSLLQRNPAHMTRAIGRVM